MSERKRLIKNTAIIAVGNLSTKLVSFFLLPLYTAILSTSEYGIVDYITSLSIFCVPFITFLMEESMFRYLIDCRTDEERKRVISLSLVIVFIGFILFSLISFPILYILKYEYTFYLVIYILTLAMGEMMSAFLRGLGKIEWYALYNFMSGTTQVILNVLFVAVFRWGVSGMLSASIFSRLLILGIYIFRIKIWEYIDLSIITKNLGTAMIKYSVPLIPNKVSWTIIKLSSRFIIMNVLGSAANGIYAVAYKFPDLMDTIYGFFYQSWKESSARVKNNGTQEEFYNDIYDYLQRFLYSLVLGMTAFMPLLFKIFINVSFFDAILYVPILLLSTYFSNMSGFYGGIFTAYKDTKIMGNTTILGAILNIIFLTSFIMYFGLYAAAMATLLSNFIIYFYRKVKVKKYISLEQNYKNVFFSVIITTIILLLFYSMNVTCQIVACLISVLYAIFTNRRLIGVLFNKE